MVVFNSAQGSIVDQSQEEYDPAWLVVHSDGVIAYTVTADMNGKLEMADLYMVNIFSAEIYPYTVSIDNVINEVPSGSVLREVDTGQIQTAYPPDESLPPETFYDKDATFTTYMTPEPATIILFALGCLTLLRNKKLNRQKC